MSELNVALSEKREWPLTLMGCFDYRDPHGRQRWWPTFCCTSLICTNLIAGRVWSKVHKETTCCCGLGCQGGALCFLTIPFGMYHPIAGMAGFCCLSNYLRAKVVREYNVQEEKTFCCGDACDPYLDYCHFGCNYPCSLFQIEVSMEEWDQAAVMATTVSVIAPVHAQPIITQKAVYH